MSFQPSQAPQTCQPTMSRQSTGSTVTVPVMIRSRVSLRAGLDVVGDGWRVGEGAHVRRRLMSGRDDNAVVQPLPLLA